jgi:hypothetical protein
LEELTRRASWRSSSNTRSEPGKERLVVYARACDFGKDAKKSSEERGVLVAAHFDSEDASVGMPVWVIAGWLAGWLVGWLTECTTRAHSARKPVSFRTPIPRAAMAPAVPPPPVLSLEEAMALVIEARAAASSSSARRSGVVRQKSVPNIVESIRTLSLVMTTQRYFTGSSFVEWILANPELALPVREREDAAKLTGTAREQDEKRAVQMGQALLDHRLAHHISDDYEFENSGSRSYVFIEDETYETRATHKVLSAIVALPALFHQGKLEIRSQTLFGSEAWRDCYGVLDDPSSKPRTLHLYKRQSAAGAPFAEYALEDCMCSLVECMDCRAGHYCFTLKARKGMSSNEVSITLCADHSKKQEGWLAALMDAGVQFQKEEEGDDLKLIKSVFQLSARKLRTHESVPLSTFQGKVCLVVNVASK